MDNIKHYYEILELQLDASKADIKQAYKDLVSVWHPDRFSHNLRLQQKAEEKIKQINAAYEFLKSYDPKDFEEISFSSTKHSASKQKGETVDYSQLNNLLASNHWQNADIETKAIILKVVGREKEGWMRREDINNLASQNLDAIDKLWLKYSNEGFGFSVQKKIWQTLGCKSDLWMPTQTKSECKFGAYVNWYVNSSWLLQWDRFDYSSPPRGSLPREYIFALSGWWSYSHSWTGYLLWGFEEVFLRV